MGAPKFVMVGFLKGVVVEFMSNQVAQQWTSLTRWEGGRGQKAKNSREPSRQWSQRCSKGSSSVLDDREDVETTEVTAAPQHKRPMAATSPYDGQIIDQPGPALTTAPESSPAKRKLRETASIGFKAYRQNRYAPKMEA